MGLYNVATALTHRWLLFRGAKSRVTQTANGAVHWYDVPGHGTRGTLVLQHGIGAEGLHFFGVLRGLRAHFSRIILPDLPGHGRSDAPTEVTPESIFDGFAAALDAALDEAPGVPAVVFGNSLGGAMAAQYAVERPERTRALMLASPAGAPLPEARLRALLAIFAFPDRASVLHFLSLLNPRVPFGASLVVGDIRARFHRPAIRALLTTVRPEHGVPVDKLAIYDRPTLLTWGKLDRLLPREILEFYRIHLPAHATIEEPEGVGHCPQVDRPGWTVRRILAFTEDLPRSAR